MTPKQIEAPDFKGVVKFRLYIAVSMVTKKHLYILRSLNANELANCLHQTDRPPMLYRILLLG